MTMELLKIRRPIYGWIPDLPDHRDKLYAQLAPIVAPGELPQQVDLRPECTPVENQGELGSCTANALAGNLEYLKKNPVQNVGARRIVPVLDFSRLFIY